MLITFKNRILIPTDEKHIEFFKWISTSKRHAITTRGHFSDFSFFPPIYYFICTIFSVESASSAMIGSTVTLKDTLKGHRFEFCSLYNSRKNEMTIWLFPESIGCFMSSLPFKSLMTLAHLHGILYSHWVGEHFSLTSLLHCYLEKMTVTWSCYSFTMIRF